MHPANTAGATVERRSNSAAGGAGGGQWCRRYQRHKT